MISLLKSVEVDSNFVISNLKKASSTHSQGISDHLLAIFRNKIIFKISDLINPLIIILNKEFLESEIVYFRKFRSAIMNPPSYKWKCQFSDCKFIFTDHRKPQAQIFKMNFRMQNGMHQRVNVNAHKVVRINVKT